MAAVVGVQVYMYAAYAHTAVAGVTVAVVDGWGAVQVAVVYNKTKFWGAPEKSVSNELEKEMFIDYVATQLN